NQPLSLAVRDIEASVGPDVDGLAITKVAGVAHLQLLDELASECEAKLGLAIGHTKFIAMIETPDAFFDMRAIAGASQRIVAMNIGGEDFALECGMQPSEEALQMPKQQMIIAARAAGIMPLGYIGTVADFSDWDKFRAMVVRSRQFGFECASCVHPGQVPIVNEAYTPSAAEAEYAKRVVAEDRAAAASGRASFQIDGKMIDIPVVERARRLLTRMARIKAREARVAK
ncbi:MAG: aldolase/citrate lyase family protein, partial [Burkholderiales bacterium]